MPKRKLLQQSKIETLNIAQQLQVTKNSVEVTWYAILTSDADYLTDSEVEIFPCGGDTPIGYKSNSFIDMRKSLARTVHVTVNRANEGGPVTEVRGRVRVKGGTQSTWSEWCPCKASKWQ